MISHRPMDYPNPPSFHAPLAFSSPIQSTITNKLYEALLDDRLASVDRQIMKLMTNSEFIHVFPSIHVLSQFT